jgi:uncharacterized protein with NRDE domain
MGVTRDGRFAALTNHRDPARMRTDAPSRGALVDAVLDGDDLGRSIADVAARREQYNGFNLLAGRWSGVAPSLSIVAHPSDGGAQPVPPGCHALSNASLDTPWPKVLSSTDGLRDALDQRGDGDVLVDRLFAILADDRVVDDAHLPATGVPLAFERALSATFIRTPGYGTRSSTVLVVDRDGRATFVERRFEPDASPDERRFVFATTEFSAVRAS